MVRSTAEDGFTLLEAMAIVAIVMIVAALAAPSFSTASRERRTHEAALSVVQGLREARAEAVGYGRAHLVRFDDAGDSGNGSIQIYRGINNGCSSNNWVTIVGTGCPDNPMCREEVLMTSFAGDGAWNLELRTINGEAQVDLCFEPSGRILWRTDAPLFTDQNQGALLGGAVFTVQRLDSAGAPEGVRRRIAMPLGGSARLMR